MVIGVGVLVYDDVDLLDVALPLEVFGAAARIAWRLHPERDPPFTVETVARTARAIRARDGLVFQPGRAFYTSPHYEVLIVPGGDVAREIVDPASVAWVAATAATARMTGAIGGGVRLLSKAGVLDGPDGAIAGEDGDRLAVAPDTGTLRIAGAGRILLAPQFAAGLALCLWIVSQLGGPGLAESTARKLGYPPAP